MTTMRAAVVDGDNLVVNIIMIDPNNHGNWAPPEGCRVVEDGGVRAEPGGVLEEDGSFSPAPRPHQPDLPEESEVVVHPMVALIEELAITKAMVQDLTMRLEQLEGKSQ